MPIPAPKRKPDMPPATPSRAAFADWQAMLRTAMFEAIDGDTIRELVLSLVEKAKKGDIAAAKLLLTYAIGSPTVNVQNAVFMGDSHAPEPLPTRPTRALPNTPEKFDAMARRARNGQGIFDPRDARHDDGNED